MPTRVAVVDEVKATPGAKSPSDNVQGGTWSAGSITHQFYPKLTIGGKPVIYEASCTFTYSGGKDSSSGADVPPTSEDVTLTATTKKTQKDESFVLVDGDSKSSANGNNLTVHTSKKLRTD